MIFSTARLRQSAGAWLAALALLVSPAFAENAVTLGKAKGPANAPVTIIEYMSPTCPACKYFHDNLEPVVAEQVAAGNVRFEVREFLRSDIDIAVSTLARCSEDDVRWHAIMGEVFADQRGLIDAAANGTAKARLQDVAKRHGIATDAAFDACLDNINSRADLAEIQTAAKAHGVVKTPSLIVNGQIKTNDADFADAAAFRKWLDGVVANAKAAQPATVAPAKATKRKRQKKPKIKKPAPVN